MDEIQEVSATTPSATPPAAPSATPPVSPPTSPSPSPTPKKKKMKELAKRVKWGLKNVGRVLKGRPPRDRELQDMHKVKPGSKREPGVTVDLLN